VLRGTIVSEGPILMASVQILVKDEKDDMVKVSASVLQAQLVMWSDCINKIYVGSATSGVAVCAAYGAQWLPDMYESSTYLLPSGRAPVVA
jgi:hypothetical protein